MPWRHSPEKHLVQFFVGVRIPFHVRQARQKRGLESDSAYYRDLIADGLSRDLGIPREEVLSWMPKGWRQNPGAVKIDTGESVNQVDKVG